MGAVVMPKIDLAKTRELEHEEVRVWEVGEEEEGKVGPRGKDEEGGGSGSWKETIGRQGEGRGIQSWDNQRGL